MKCSYCGHEIQEGMLYCEECGREVRIVPDYSPLEDMLTEQIRGAINGEESYDDYIDYGSIRNTSPRGDSRSTVRDMRDGMSRSTVRDVRDGMSRSTVRDVRDGMSRSTVRDVRDGMSRSTVRDMRDGMSRSTVRDMRDGMSRSTSRDMRDGMSRSTSRDMRDGMSRSTSRDMRDGMSRSTSRDMRGGGSRGTVRDVRDGTGRNTVRDVRDGVSRNTGARKGSMDGYQAERERKRRQAERRKAMERKRAGCLLAMLLLAVALVGGCVFLYTNSYRGMVGKGNQALAAGEYEKAIGFFERAVGKDEKKAAAYVGLSRVYIAKKDLDWAESIFQEAVKRQPENADIYQAYVEFYMDTDQKAKIPQLLKDVDVLVAEKLGGYIVEGPDFSLPEGDSYDDVQELTLTVENGYEIYYTDNGDEVTVHSMKYTESLQIREGENVITAIAVNKKGVPSLPVRKTYTVELPIADAPAVSPSTGQYRSAVQIEVKIPEGYEAYYTMNGEEPTTASSKYTGPIDMPEGETLFKAVLINAAGRMSGVTTRNYVLETE